MSTGRTWQTASTSLNETLSIATKIGRKLRGGEVIELVGDLGSGKTAFVTGLAKGIGSHDHVRSPSFTLGNQYKSDTLTLYHFDFYRLGEAGIMKQEIEEILQEPKAAVAIEWGEIVHGVLPKERLAVIIKAVGESDRRLMFSCDKNLEYLIT